jgi:hypothetical protein
VKAKYTNVHGRYKFYKDKISHSGEENVWSTHDKPGWWGAAEELWATRAATAPDIVIEVGNGVKIEGAGGAKRLAAALQAECAPDDCAMGDGALEAGGEGSPGDAAAGAAAAAPAAPAKTAGAKGAVAAAAEAEVAARAIRNKRKSAAKEQAAKEQVDATVEAGKRINADLVAQFSPLFASMTQVMGQLPDRMVAALQGHDKKKKKHTSYSAHSSPSTSE